jgi:hypothetical protein
MVRYLDRECAPYVVLFSVARNLAFVSMGQSRGHCLSATTLRNASLDTIPGTCRWSEPRARGAPHETVSSRLSRLPLAMSRHHQYAE